MSRRARTHPVGGDHQLALSAKAANLGPVCDREQRSARQTILKSGFAMLGAALRSMFATGVPIKVGFSDLSPTAGPLSWCYDCRG